MPIVFAAIGGGAVVGVIAIGSHSDHHDHSNWHEYSNAAEVMKRKAAGLKENTESAARELHNFKFNEVNPNLTSEKLKQAPAMTVNLNEMNKNAVDKITQEQNREVQRDTRELQTDLQEIDKLLSRIEQLKGESGA